MIICFIYTNGFSQDSLLMHYLIRRISTQHVKEDNFFLKGIFPSYISSSPFYNSVKKDNNIFFTGLIIFTLKNIQPGLAENDKLASDSVILKSLPLFSKFKNRKNRNTYNFWRTDSAYQFPYTNWIYRIKKNTALPDDMDDTIFSLFALDVNDSTAETIHELMQHYVNSDSTPVRMEDKRYQKFHAYSTWFGKNFPVVFDIGVLSNVLSFVQLHHLQWSAADSASLNFIVSVIKNKDHLNNPLKISPYYGNSSIILYNLARLMRIKKIAALEQLKTSLIADAVSQFSHTNNILEKIILCSAIIKWGYVPPQIKLPPTEDIKSVIEENNLPFFIGNIPSYLPSTEKNILLKKNIGLFYHYCPAYNDLLFLEYLTLKNRN